MDRPRTGQKDRYSGKHVTFVDNSEQVIKALRKQSFNALGKAGKIYAKALADAAPDRTGALKRAAGFRVRNRGDGVPMMEVGFFNRKRAKKALAGKSLFANPAWIEFGTKPHILNAGWHRGPSGKKALANQNAGIIYGRRQVHKGQAPRPFIKRTVLANVSAARAAMEPLLKELEKSVEQLAGIPEPIENDQGESP